MTKQRRSGGRRRTSFVVFLSVVLLLVHLPLSASVVSDSSRPAEADSCCACGQEFETTEPAVETDAPVDTCCPSGCADCLLPCCTSPLLVPIETSRPASARLIHRIVRPLRTTPPLVEPWTVFHPPR